MPKKNGQQRFAAIHFPIASCASFMRLHQKTNALRAGIDLKLFTEIAGREGAIVFFEWTRILDEDLARDIADSTKKRIDSDDGWFSEKEPLPSR